MSDELRDSVLTAIKSRVGINVHGSLEWVDEDGMLEEIDRLYQEQMHQMSQEHLKWWGTAIAKHPNMPMLQLFGMYRKWLDGLEPEEK
jgi:hypothetical protein